MGPSEGSSGPSRSLPHRPRSTKIGLTTSSRRRPLARECLLDLLSRRCHVPALRELADVHAEPAHEHRIRLDGLDLGRLLERRDLRQRLLDVRRERVHLLPLTGRVALLESRLDARREELERRADVLVAVVAALLDEDRLIDADPLERLEVRAHLVGIADAAGRHHRERRRALELLPDARARGDVRTRDVEVRERIAEELEALEALADRRLAV